MGKSRQRLRLGNISKPLISLPAVHSCVLSLVLQLKQSLSTDKRPKTIVWSMKHRCVLDRDRSNRGLREATAKLVILCPAGPLKDGGRLPDSYSDWICSLHAVPTLQLRWQHPILVNPTRSQRRATNWRSVHASHDRRGRTRIWACRGRRRQTVGK